MRYQYPLLNCCEISIVSNVERGAEVASGTISSQNIGCYRRYTSIRLMLSSSDVNKTKFLRPRPK